MSEAEETPQPDEEAPSEEASEGAETSASDESEEPTKVGPAPSAAMEALMAEALASVEARERGEEIEIEVEDDSPPKPDLQEAVTEAIIKAKQQLEEALAAC